MRNIAEIKLEAGGALLGDRIRTLDKERQKHKFFRYFAGKINSKISSYKDTSALKTPFSEKHHINPTTPAASTLDKKKPFSRPFSKSRLEGHTSTPRMSSPSPTAETSQLLRQNQELRQRLQDEASSYRRRIDTYKQAQQNQAALVGRLQNKVLQYKQRCSDLEGKMHETVNKPLSLYSTSGTGGKGGLSTCPSGALSSSSHLHAAGPSSLPCIGPPDSPPPQPPPCSRDYVHHGEHHDDVVRSLDEEKHRCEQLMGQNNALRQQLEESNRINEALTNDLQKLTNDWACLRDELVHKEDEFKEEEQAFNDYYHSEHNRLLKMWREVVAVKRAFKDMQTSLKSEVGKHKVDVAGTNREVLSACNSVIFNLKQSGRAGEAQQMQFEKESNDLKAQIFSLKSQYDNARHEINQRDLRLQELQQQLKMVEDRCAQAESQAMHASRLSDEIDRLNGTLRDIAHAVVQDAEKAGETDEGSSAAQHMHLSQAGMVPPPRSPRRGSGRTSQAFAEGTISAVQAALHKYQLSLHDLQVKLQASNDNLQATKKQLDTSENTKQILTIKVTQLTEKLDASNSQLSELFKERDSLQKTLDGLRAEKLNCERGRAELNSIIENLSSDYEKLQLNNGKLQKYIDSLEEDKKALELEIQRILKDKDILEMNLRAEEDRGSRLREETITLREELNKLYLSKDLLEQQRMESDSLISLLEKQKSDLEYELDKTLMERSEVLQRLEKTSHSNESASQELRAVKDHLVEIENERNKLRCQTSDQATDISSLKKELISLEQIKLELDSDKLNLCEKQKFLEMEKEKLEQEFSCVNRERADLHNQLNALNRKKEGIGEELMRTRQRLEQANETNNRLNRSLEELVKENEERQVIIEGHEKELQRLQELLASLRSEKESLEAVLFDTNTTLEASEEKRNQLERDVQELLVKEESLKNHVARLMKDLDNCNRRAQEMKTQMNNAARAQEAEYQQKMSQLKASGDDAVKKLNDEKEMLRQTLEKRMQHALQALQNAKDEEIEKLQERLEAIQAHLESLCQQHEETLIRAENEKQQALLMAHRDKQAVSEKLEAIERDLKAECENSDRIRRECAAKQEKDRNVIHHLKDELAKLRTRGEELKTHFEEHVSKLDLQITSIKEERDNANRQLEECKVEIRLREDKVDSLNNQLQDVLRKLKEVENAFDAARKELTDTRRALADSNIERDKYSNSNRDLREHVKRVESAKREQARILDDALQKVASIEESKNNLENEKARLSTLLKETENHLARTAQELNITRTSLQKACHDKCEKDTAEKELVARLTGEIEERERVQQELCQVKKQLTELDASLCATRQELGRARCHGNQEEHRWHTREQELVARLDEGRCREKRLEDLKHNLEVCLADATQQIQELKARLGGAEGRIRALEEQLSVTEAHKKDTENKLSSIAHTLRRIAGVQFDGSVSLPYRLMSPSRRYSPVRSSACPHDYDTRSTCGDGPVDVDPELVRKGVRTLMHQVAQIEREKDDYKAQLSTAKKQLHEAAEHQSKCENKLSKLQQALRSCQEEKTTFESLLATKTSTLQSVEDALKQKSDEVNMLREKGNNLEAQLGAGAEEKGQCEERLEKCRQHGSRLESEKRQLQEDLARTEARASKLDLQRVALEGDISRLQMALTEKENTIKTLQERLENQARASSQLEDRCVSLKSTVDQLKERLQKSAVLETELRGEINALTKERSEQGHCLQSGQEKLKQLQKSLSGAENERRILAERLDGAQNTVNELRRSQQSQQDTLQRLQEQVAELEVQKSSLESQLRIAKWNQENADQAGIGGPSSADGELSRQLINAQREKSELRAKLETSTAKIRQLECDRKSKFCGHVQFDREKSLYGDCGEMDSNRMETDNYLSRSGAGGPNSLNNSFNCGLDHSLIEQENRDLRMKVRRLETLLAEKEAELARAKARLLDTAKCVGGAGDSDRYRSAQLQAEKLLDAREQAHRQQVLRLENQISMLREQLAQEAKRRQQYILRSSRANREMQHLRHTLGDSLRHVSQDPLDSGLLENETRRLDTAVSLSLPPSTGHDYDRGLSPRK